MADLPAGPVSAINLLSLRPGATLEQFARFSREIDQPTCLARDVVEAFDVFAVPRREAGSSGFDVVEVMTVRSWDEWQQALREPEMLPVIKAFDQLVAADTVRTVFGSRVAPRD